MEQICIVVTYFFLKKKKQKKAYLLFLNEIQETKCLVVMGPVLSPGAVFWDFDFKTVITQKTQKEPLSFPSFLLKSFRSKKLLQEGNFRDVHPSLT